MATAALDLSGLNPEQYEAVVHPGGPMLIFAGAGSGKTRVITTRIARLLQEGVKPWRILAVTFTNKAAREMRERVEALTDGSAIRDMWIGTFHSLCARLLRTEGRSIGLDQGFVIYDDSEQLGTIREALKSRGIDDKSIQPRAVLSEISRAKERLQGPDRYAETATGYFESIVSEIYRDYDSRLRRSNALDFDDILFFAHRLLEQAPAVREKYQEKFLHVLVDEYQDVNRAQYEIVHLLAAKHRNVVVVGDDDQSIYAWRGADVSLILKFSSDYPDAKIVKLERNYRSTGNILAAANAVISKNRGRADKRLWTENESGPMITLTQTGTERDEGMMVAEQVERLVAANRRTYGSFAVLYRTNAQSRAMEEAFLTYRIPHVLVGGQRFYERKEVRDMISYLRLAYNGRDDASFRRAVAVPPRGIGATSMQKLEDLARKREVPLLEAATDQALQPDLKRAGASLRGFADVVDRGRQAAGAGSVAGVLRELLTASGYLDMLRAEHSQEAEGRLENLQELLNVTAEYDATADDPSLGGFLESVALVADVDSLKGENGDAVTLMTLHSAKGLEFPVVFLTGMEEGVFPHARSLTSDRELEEERRLAYVGMTRAREELHLLHAARRSTYGTPNFNAPSRFLQDVPRELVEHRGDYGYGGGSTVRQERNQSYTVVEPKPEPKANWKPPFTMGQQVRHGKFGIGVVVACSPIKDDVEVTVAFPGVTGVKKLVQKLAKLEAI
ncbi:DNA helicase PcrA [soil metagenome]